MYLNPGNGLTTGKAVTDRLQLFAERQNLVVTIHAGVGRRHVGVTGFFHLAMAISAIDSQFSGMQGMLKRHRLHGLITNSGIFGSHVVSETGRDGRPDYEQSYHNLNRGLVGFFRENCRHSLNKLSALSDQVFGEARIGIIK